MKMPCELIVTHILPTARGALARDLVTSHGMTQTQVAKLFGVTSAAVSQYLKGMRGGNNLIDRSAYKDDFYAEIARMADEISNGADVTESLCGICNARRASSAVIVAHHPRPAAGAVVVWP